MHMRSYIYAPFIKFFIINIINSYTFIMFNKLHMKEIIVLFL